MPAHLKKRFRTGAAILISLCVFPATSAAQANPATPRVFTLEEAVNFALQNYPAIRASLERGNAAKAGVTLARTSYLPRADMLWQGNRATRNNIFGLLLPQSVIPSITGPVLPSTSNQGVWGSAAGLLFSWEPFDFGVRSAKVNAARAAQNRGTAEGAVTRLDVALAAVNAYLALLAARESERAAQADVQRREIFTKSVHVLVENQLRPGADASRAEAELARAKAGLARAQQQEAVSRVTLADVLGIADAQVEVEEGPLDSLPPPTIPEAPTIAKHPVAEAQQARVEEFGFQVHALDRAYFPKFNFQSAVFGRGTGAGTNGTFAGGSNGLGLDRSNWAMGLTVTFSLLDTFSIRARKAVEAANQRAEAALYDQTIQDLTGQLRRAQASLQGARQVAGYTPVELQAARETELQQRARYQAALATLVEVADAQSLLVQAETDDALARLAVWQNLASVAAAQGDLQPFLESLRQKTQGGP